MIRKAWERFGKFCGLVSKFMLGVAGFSLIIMLIVVCIDIIGRNTSLFSSIGGTELAGYFMVFIVFAGSAYAVQNNGFIRVEILYNKISRTNTAVLNILNVVDNVLSVIFMFFISKYVTVMTYDSYIKNVRSQGILQTPLFLPRIIMAFGCYALFLVLVYDVIKSVLNILNIDSGEDYTLDKSDMK